MARMQPLRRAFSGAAGRPRGRLGGAFGDKAAHWCRGARREQSPGSGAELARSPAAPAPSRGHLERARRPRGLRLRHPRAGDPGAGRLPARDDHERHDARRLHGRGVRGRAALGTPGSGSRSSAGCWRRGRPPRRSRTSLLRHPARNTMISVKIWAGAAVVFTVVNSTYSVELGRLGAGGHACSAAPPAARSATCSRSGPPGRWSRAPLPARRRPVPAARPSRLG